MRSFRAENLSNFVEHVLNNNPAEARESFEAMGNRYPIVLTRDLEAARDWLKQKARGSERTGFLASSGGYRLRPCGVNPRSKIDPPNWFLNASTDVRSSHYLEEVATEFDVQGLELDWVGLCWDADLRWDADAWAFKRFRGTVWQTSNKPDAQRYLMNAYRVLMTRARQGMVIFVPPGEASDPTRRPEWYDATAQYLERCGVPLLDKEMQAAWPNGTRVGSG
jgi:hypothetical protein